jgi:hypothetical protein
VDRTYRFARVDAARPVRVGAAPVRAEVVVTGDSVPNAAPAAAPAAAVLGVRVYAEVPEAWARSYAEARAANDQLAALDTCRRCCSTPWARCGRWSTSAGRGSCGGARRRWWAAPWAC